MCIHGVCSSYPDILLCIVFARALSGSLVKLLNLCIRNIKRVLDNTFMHILIMTYFLMYDAKGNIMHHMFS